LKPLLGIGLYPVNLKFMARRGVGKIVGVIFGISDPE